MVYFGSEIHTKYLGMLSNLRSIEMVKASSDDPTKVSKNVYSAN